MGPEQKLVFLHCIIHPKCVSQCKKSTMLSDLSFSVDVTGLMNQLNCSAGAFLCLKCAAW